MRCHSASKDLPWWSCGLVAWPYRRVAYFCFLASSSFDQTYSPFLSFEAGSSQALHSMTRLLSTFLGLCVLEWPPRRPVASQRLSPRSWILAIRGAGLRESFFVTEVWVGREQHLLIYYFSARPAELCSNLPALSCLFRVRCPCGLFACFCDACASLRCS